MTTFQDDFWFINSHTEMKNYLGGIRLKLKLGREQKEKRRKCYCRIQQLGMKQPNKRRRHRVSSTTQYRVLQKSIGNFSFENATKTTVITTPPYRAALL